MYGRKESEGDESQAGGQAPLAGTEHDRSSMGTLWNTPRGFPLPRTAAAGCCCLAASSFSHSAISSSERSAATCACEHTCNNAEGAIDQ